MDIREYFWLVALVAVLQLCLGVMVYLISPSASLDIVTVTAAIAMMSLVAGTIAVVLTFLFKRYASERTMKVAMMTLTEDERRVLELVIQLKEVRQDDLRRKVDMSKSKLSALVNNLERKGAVLKLRHHKTNILRPTKEFGG